MLLSVFGTPSALMYGGLNVVRKLTDLVLGAHQLANANSTEQLRERLSEPGTIEDAKVVFYSDLPNPDLCTRFVKTGAPIVLLVDNFDDVVQLASRSLRPGSAHSFRPRTEARCESAWSDSGRSIGRYCRVLRLATKSDYAGESCKELIYRREKSSLFAYLSKTLPHATLPGVAAQQMIITERNLVAQLSRPYSATANGRPLDQMDWPIDMFTDSSAFDWPFSGRVELLGPARFLAHVPQLHLTEGKWCVDVVFEAQDNHSGNQLYADVYSGDILGVVTAPLSASGTTSFRFCSSSSTRSSRRKFAFGRYRGGCHFQSH